MLITPPIDMNKLIQLFVAKGCVYLFTVNIDLT